MDEDQVTETTETEVEQADLEDDFIFTPEGDAGIVWISDLSRTKETIFYNPKGDIHVIHEITLGDVAIITLLSALLIFKVLDRVIRR